jgi:hypothetical protein
VKLVVGKDTWQAMLLGAVCGVFFCATNASAPVVYAVSLIAGTVFCLVKDGRPEGGLFRRGRRR